MGVAADSQFHVLAVDDSLIDRKLIERLLKISSFQVTTVDSGSKALEFLGWRHDEDGERKHCSNQTCVEVNLVITDYCMPGMTGYDLLKKMKECSYLRNIPVVIMSSENVQSRITRCLEEGAEDFFLKPVRLTDVNKLKPHMIMMMKNKNDFQKPQENQEHDFKVEQSDSELIRLPTEEQSLQQHNNNNINNKRKSMDDGLPLDRARPRYNGALTVLSN
ncbi:hypothetical protein ACP275_11G013100 [Erythranthe tilingii]